MTHFSEKIWTELKADPDTNLNPPATQNEIDRFEQEFGVNFPPSYREFLLAANGGVVGYARVFGVGRNDHLDLQTQIKQMTEWIEGVADRRVLLFASDWGGSYFCFDLQKPDKYGEFPVVCWNHEYSEEPDDKPMLWSKIATDFVAFCRETVES